MDQFHQIEVEKIQADRRSGATDLVLRAAGLLLTAGDERADLEVLADACVAAQPAMAGMRTLRQIVRESRAPSVAIGQFREQVRRAPAAIARFATDLLLVQGISGLRGARGLVDELGFVDPDGFDAFARALNGSPGLEGVLLIRRVPDDQRALFEVEIGPSMRDVTKGGRLVPSAGRPVHFAVER